MLTIFKRIGDIVAESGANIVDKEDEDEDDFFDVGLLNHPQDLHRILLLCSQLYLYSLEADKESHFDWEREKKEGVYNDLGGGTEFNVSEFLENKL